MSDNTVQDIIKAVKNYIALEKESGIDDIMLKSIIKTRKDISLHGHDDIESFPVKEYTLKDKKLALDRLKQDVLECSQCSLCQSRRNAVFGEGAIDAKLMFIGEAPGMQEDIQGRPFAGKAGTLLTKIIEAIGLKREDVYITNCLKCRPPQNRSPLPSEIIACREFFLKQVEIIGPEVICCLGKFAAQTLLMSEEPISNLRGKFYEIGDIKVMPTFHPAYLLSNPQDKRLAWEDMKKIRDLLKDK